MRRGITHKGWSTCKCTGSRTLSAQCSRCLSSTRSQPLKHNTVHSNGTQDLPPHCAQRAAVPPVEEDAVVVAAAAAVVVLDVVFAVVVAALEAVTILPVEKSKPGMEILLTVQVLPPSLVTRSPVTPWPLASVFL